MFASPTQPQRAADVEAGLAPGVVIHQYELIRELGRGGMGVVFAARDTRLGRRVAIKFVLHASRDVAERFLVEARATAQCSHESIVIIHAVDEYAGMPYMVLEFLEGQTLRELMDTQLSIPPSRVVEIMLPVARALTRAHELGIVHRDLKPENVFVTAAGQVKVLDFGIAKALGTGDTAFDPVHVAGRDAHLTANSTMVGTVAYMAPEQMGMDSVDHRVDLWAAGVMMYEMLAGQHPIDPPRTQALINSAVSDELMPAIGVIEPGTPVELAEVVAACLVKPKLGRLATAAELAARLEALRPGRSGRALADGESPYPGLTAFQEADADRFFGRAREVTRMVAKIRELPLTGVIGPSGAGKSSFVRAGVGPALKASGEQWLVVTIRPGRQPLAALAGVVHKVAQLGGTLGPFGGAPDTNLDALARRLSIEPGYLGATLRARARQTGAHILLFVDQLEELYTLVPDAGERRAFTAALTGMADDSTAPLRVVVSMRSDFLDRIAEDAAFVEELSRGLVFVGTLDDAGLREALVQPIEMVGYRFETPALVDDMLHALAGTPGALPLLQFASSKLWDARDRERRMLTAASDRAIGGVSGALATHANDVVASMDAGAQRIAKLLFRALVTPEHTRAIVERADLVTLAPDHAEVQRVLDQLVAARLLVVQTRGDGGGASVEIVHESLIDRWPTLLRWLEEDQEDTAFLAQISAAAKQWDTRQRAVGLLWRGDAFDETRRWLGHRERALAPRDRAFVDAVITLGRRRARTQRVALIAAFVVMATIATGAVVGYLRIGTAEANEAAKAEQAQRALERMTSAQDARARAEAAQRRADQTAKAAQAATEEAQGTIDAKNADLATSRTELAAENQKLHDALTAADAARRTAEAATQKARAATDEVDRARHALEAEVREKQRHIQELEDEKRKLSTKLK